MDLFSVLEFVSKMGRLHGPNYGKRANPLWNDNRKIFEYCDRINGEPTEFEWSAFPGFDTLQLFDEVNNLLYRLDTRKFNKKNSIHVDV